jgi:hypothetical protein
MRVKPPLTTALTFCFFPLVLSVLHSVSEVKCIEGCLLNPIFLSSFDTFLKTKTLRTSGRKNIRLEKSID